MSLSDLEIAQIVSEVAPRVCGQVLQKVHEEDDALVLTFAKERLLVSTHPRASRLGPAAAQKGPHQGGAAALTVLLKKRLLGLRLVTLSVLSPGERVVVFDFGPTRERLIGELTGPHANVFLVEPGGRIAASLKTHRSTRRSLAPGDPYTPPSTAPGTPKWHGLKRFGDSPGVSERASTHYDALLKEARAALLCAQAAAALRRALHRIERREAALRGDLRRATEAAVFRKYGDLLLCHLAQLRGRGASSVCVADDFESGALLTIPLEPALDGRENATRYYRQHKRLSAGTERIFARLAQTEEARRVAERKLAELATLSTDDLAALVNRLPAKRRLSSAVPERLPYREFRSLSGAAIWVGRSAKDNDALTFRHARGNDLWLHTRDAPGAHVVVPRAGVVEESTLLDAATLAAHFSPLAGEAQIDVTYTQVKHLRKPRGIAAGAVFVSDAKTVRIRMEQERVARLFARDGDSP